MYAELEQRICRTCKETRDKKEFSRMSRGKKTTQPDCKKCRSHKEFVRGLKRNYDMTPAQYNELLIAQKECCACCGAHKSNYKRRLHVDHEHATGQVRALLCTLCNPMVGFAKENIKRLEMTIAYVSKFKK